MLGFIIHANGSRAMQSWEYSTVQSWKEGAGFQWSSEVSATLSTMGEQGWELVCVIETQHHMLEWIFKRPQPQPANIMNLDVVERVA
jgi:hypothetical protein